MKRHLPSVPQQDQGWTLLQKAFGSSIPTEQMEKSRLLPGGVPAPSPFLPQAVPGVGRFSVPAKPSAARGRCGNCFMRLPGTQDPLWGIQGGAGLLWFQVFSLQTRPLPKCVIPHVCVGEGGCHVHVASPLPTTARPWGRAALGPQRSADL